jgi:uncharacterized membrane protein YfcA
MVWKIAVRRDCTEINFRAGIAMTIEPTTLCVAATGIFVIGFMKGAFGGGFAIIGIPFLALVMDPIAAGVLLAPLFIVMDIFALRYWKPATWSKPDLSILVPGQLVGIAIGFFVLRDLDRHAIEIVMAVVTLTFAVLWFRGGAAVSVRTRSPVAAVLAGGASGVTTMVAHSGGPPLAMYLLPLGLSKQVYAGTTSVFFTVGNLVKVGPWLVIGQLSPALLTMLLLGVPVAVAGVWTGWRLHQRLDQVQLYRACYTLLFVTALKLLWDGVGG